MVHGTDASPQVL